ncbi:MAG: radical SAM family heme chaperone HemW [Clostridia bacterium]|nr:radical SAM family heme chaperone HemW [Clostridia bacterium]
MSAGIYIHVPFCVSKCPYCDFYSLPLTEEEALSSYMQALIRSMQPFAGNKADTLYFGGGTPSLLGGKRIARLIDTAREYFSLPDDAEITLEANPADDLKEVFSAFVAAGGNRLSLGMQASDPDRLSSLGRRHTPYQLEQAVRDAHTAGIHNFSLDMMLATPGQDLSAVQRDVDTCVALGASHVSAYLLKIEPGTPFFNRRDTLSLPDEDRSAELYEYTVKALEKAGFLQYEISNFARPGRESRHNLKYWTGEEYYGFGPAASSFFRGHRYSYPRDLNGFLNGQTMLPDEDGEIVSGGEEEYAIFRLRLTAGLEKSAFEQKFSHPIPEIWLENARRLPGHLVQVTPNGIALTTAGFLLSNGIIQRILFDR